MRVRQIGSTVFDNNTNIVVDSTALDAVGGGFRVNDLDGPQPFAVEIAFVRSTRQEVLDALNLLAYDLYIRPQRRTFLNVAGGVVVWVEDRNGNAILRSFLTNASVNLISIESATTGVIARARVTGMLISPFITSNIVSQTFSSLKAYGLYTLPLSNIDESTLAIHNIDVTINNNTGLRNALFVFEILQTLGSSQKIYRKSPTSVSNNLVLESFTAEPGANLQRAYFATSGNGTIMYYITDNELIADLYNLYFEVYLPFAPSSDVTYKIIWDEQPEISGIVNYKQTFIKAGMYTRANAACQITVNITNAPANTYISPLIFIPVDGVFVYNATATNLSRFFTNYPATENRRSFFCTGSDYGELRGLPGFIAGKYLAFFAGMMNTTISNLTTNVTIRSRRIEPAAFM
jgi:hypothetical protein